MKKIKHELIKEFLEYFKFNLNEFEIIEMPYILGYILKDKNNESMMISIPLATTNLINITYQDQTQENNLKTKGLNNEIIWTKYIERDK